jgi:hypothetical protein
VVADEPGKLAEELPRPDDLVRQAVAEFELHVAMADQEQLRPSSPRRNITAPASTSRRSPSLEKVPTVVRDLTRQQCGTAGRGARHGLWFGLAVHPLSLAAQRRESSERMADHTGPW